MLSLVVCIPLTLLALGSLADHRQAPAAAAKRLLAVASRPVAVASMLHSEATMHLPDKVTSCPPQAISDSAKRGKPSG